jgi:hypothetical protein
MIKCLVRKFSKGISYTYHCNLGVTSMEVYFNNENKVAYLFSPKYPPYENIFTLFRKSDILKQNI